jgi:hypothetical protein
MGKRFVLGHAGLALLLAACVTTAASAQEGKGGSVHRMLIQNGSNRSVHYFSDQLSEGDKAVLRELERAENQALYLDNLLALRQQYVNGEQALQARRQGVQEKLYGQSITSTQYGGFAFTAPYGFYPYSYPYYSYYTAFPRWYRRFPAYAVRTSATTVTRSLAEGVGDEGAIKTAMAQVLARQATPEYAAQVERNYLAALDQASRSEPIRAALGMSDKGGIRFAAYERTEQAPYTLTLKGGEQVRGSTLKEEGEWYVLETDKELVRVSKSEVIRINQRKTPPAK